jgi:uncharacterized protein (DUF433 family)
MPTAVGNLIERSPSFRGGRPCIAGTGVSVRAIAVLHRHRGMTAEAIADERPDLSLAQIYAALAYYYANPSEIEKDLDAEETAAAEFLSK